MKRNARSLGRVRDVVGCLWDVREKRDTKHGFELLFGWPASLVGKHQGGVSRLIVTQPLVEFWEVHKTIHSGVIYDLPAGRTTLKRVRQNLGFNYLEDLSEFWKKHIKDLEKLSAREFADKYNVDLLVVSEAHRKWIGRRYRELGWWRKARPLKILRSDLSLSKMGEKLGISISQTKRLRDRARRLN